MKEVYILLDKQKLQKATNTIIGSEEQNGLKDMKTSTIMSYGGPVQVKI